MYLYTDERDWKMEERGEQHRERGERERFDSGKRLIVFVSMSYNCIHMCIIYICKCIKEDK